MILPNTQTQPVITKHNTQISASRAGVLLVSAGGIGCEATDKARMLLQQLGYDSPFYHISVDTDSSQTSLAHQHVNIGINRSQAATIRANAALFGPVVVEIQARLGHMFDPVELDHGARTTPPMTQVMCEYHKLDIIKAFRKGVDYLMQWCKKIRIFIVHSTGGGSGRAISILLPKYLADPKFRNQITYGYDTNILDVPVTISGYPINHARHGATELQSVKILSNHVAWSRESDYLLRNQQLAYACHVGYSNHSAVNDTSDKLTDVMAEAVYDLMVNFPYFKSRWVDSVGSPHTPYVSNDQPEQLFPSVADTRRKFYP